MKASRLVCGVTCPALSPSALHPLVTTGTLPKGYENICKLKKGILPPKNENKTAKLLTAPLLSASLVAGGKCYEELKEFGMNLGVLFQITDDIMDEEGTLDSIGKTPHKDKEVDKLTSVKLFGLDGAKNTAKMHYLKCKELLLGISGSDFLSAFTDKMYKRKS